MPAGIYILVVLAAQLGEPDIPEPPMGGNQAFLQIPLTGEIANAAIRTQDRDGELQLASQVDASFPLYLGTERIVGMGISYGYWRLGELELHELPVGVRWFERFGDRALLQLWANAGLRFGDELNADSLYGQFEVSYAWRMGDSGLLGVGAGYGPLWKGYVPYPVLLASYQFRSPDILAELAFPRGASLSWRPHKQWRVATKLDYRNGVFDETLRYARLDLSFGLQRSVRQGVWLELAAIADLWESLDNSNGAPHFGGQFRLFVTPEVFIPAGL